MGFLKKIFTAFLLCTPLYADQVAVSQFKGLNNNENPVIIGNEFASDLLNVDVTPTGKSIKKRSGFGVYKALATSAPMHGGFHSFDSSGNDVQIWGSSTSLYGIVAGGTPIQLVSSATLNSTWDCTDTQGNSYCVDSSRDAFIRTDGTTMSWFTSPLGTMVESTPDRVIVAGVSGFPNTLYVSQSNTFTNFTTGVNATDAFTEVIASPGSKLTHIRWGCGKLLWWKDQSFGYFDFDDQYTADVKTISDSIGTFDNTSAIDPGGQVWFRGQDGHTWMYDCSSISKESIDITPNIQASGNRIANSWTQTTSVDFNNGFGVNVSTSSDQVSLSYLTDSFPDLSNWVQARNTWTVAGGIVQSPSVANYSTLVKTVPVSSLSSSGFRVGISGAWQTGLSGINPVSAGINIGIVNSSTQGYVAVFGKNPGNGKVTGSFVKISGTVDGTGDTIVGSNGDSSGSADTAFHYFELGFNDTTNTLTAYYDGAALYSTTDSSYSSLSKPYIRCYDQASLTCQFQNFSVGNSTGSFYSAVHNAPNINSWSTFGANYQSGAGSQTFYLRSSTNSFTVASSTPSWTAQSAGTLITISTGTYFQLRDDFVGSASSQTVVLNDFTINWFEGTAIDQAYMLYFDNAIWESVAFGSGQSVNNYIFKYDLINNGWTLYNFGVGGLLVQSNTLYFGDTLAGNVFNFGSSTSDNGVAINAFWKSKDFTGADPFLQSQLKNIDTFAKKDQGATLTTVYTVDTSTTTNYSMSLSHNTQSIIQSRKLLPSGKLGQVFNIQYGDTSTSSAWELLGYRIGFIQLPYRPSSP